MTLTFAQKEVRKNRKKAREAEEKYNKTGNKDFLSKRDEYNDLVVKLESNMKKDMQKKKLKKQTTISDEDVFSQAQAYNLKIKETMEEKTHKIYEKREEMEKRRKQLLNRVKDRKTQEKEYIEKHRTEREIQEKKMKQYREMKIKEYLEENPHSSYSEAQKAFVRNHNKMMEYFTAREDIICKLMMLGMERIEAEKKFEEILNKEEKQK